MKSKCQIYISEGENGFYRDLSTTESRAIGSESKQLSTLSLSLSLSLSLPIPIARIGTMIRFEKGAVKSAKQ